MNTENQDSTEVWPLMRTWWRRICGVEYDVDRYNDDEKDQDKAWNNFVGPAICTFLGLTSKCFPHYYLQGQATRANLSKIPPELCDFFLSFLYDSHDGHNFICDPKVWVSCLESEASKDLGVSAEKWVDVFNWLVELTPCAVHPVSRSHYAWNEFSSAIHFRRLLNSLPRDNSNDNLAEFLRQARVVVVVGNNFRLIDSRLRSTRVHESRFAAFLFDNYLYSSRNIGGEPTCEDIYRIKMLLNLERDLQITIPRAEPLALKVDINRSIKTSEAAELLLDFSSCYPLPCRYLRLPTNGSRLKGVYIKD